MTNMTAAEARDRQALGDMTVVEIDTNYWHITSNDGRWWTARRHLSVGWTITNHRGRQLGHVDDRGVRLGRKLGPTALKVLEALSAGNNISAADARRLHTKEES